jgi:hypothetical protein
MVFRHSLQRERFDGVLKALPYCLRLEGSLLKSRIHTTCLGFHYSFTTDTASFTPFLASSLKYSA